LNSQRYRPLADPFVSALSLTPAPTQVIKDLEWVSRCT